MNVSARILFSRDLPRVYFLVSIFIIQRIYLFVFENVSENGVGIFYSPNGRIGRVPILFSLFTVGCLPTRAMKWLSYLLLSFFICQFIHLKSNQSEIR